MVWAMDILVAIVFVLTYLGMALGRVPGLKLDRTGIALVGLVVLLVSGAITLDQAGAVLDMPTLLLLFGLMILSAQFQAAGVYSAAAYRVASASGGGARLLLLTIVSAGLLSAVLANDIVVFAMAPVIAQGVRARGLDPRPFLLGLAGGANAGSVMTLIGNPQNILIGQRGELDFWHYAAVAVGPGLISMGFSWLFIRWLWRRELDHRPESLQPAGVGLSVDRWQSLKGVAAVAALLVLFSTPLPREIGALAVAGLLLTSRRLSSRHMIQAVDWHLLVLFACLFVITDCFAATRLTADGVDWLTELQLLPDQMSVLAPATLIASNTIGNVPATMVFLSLWPFGDPGPLYGLAILSTLAGNFLLVGSLANIIMVERAALPGPDGQPGIRVSFADFARAGIPMTLASLAVSCLWLWAGGWMRW